MQARPEMLVLLEMQAVTAAVAVAVAVATAPTRALLGVVGLLDQA